MDTLFVLIVGLRIFFTNSIANFFIAETFFNQISKWMASEMHNLFCLKNNVSRFTIELRIIETKKWNIKKFKHLKNKEIKEIETLQINIEN